MRILSIIGKIFDTLDMVSEITETHWFGKSPNFAKTVDIPKPKLYIFLFLV